MENIDRFFDAYERLVPCWFGDAFVAVLVLTPILWLAL